VLPSFHRISQCVLWLAGASRRAGDFDFPDASYLPPPGQVCESADQPTQWPVFFFERVDQTQFGTGHGWLLDAFFHAKPKAQDHQNSQNSLISFNHVQVQPVVGFTPCKNRSHFFSASSKMGLDTMVETTY